MPPVSGSVAVLPCFTVVVILVLLCVRLPFISVVSVAVLPCFLVLLCVYFVSFVSVVVLRCFLVLLCVCLPFISVVSVVVLPCSLALLCVCFVSVVSVRRRGGGARTSARRRATLPSTSRG